MRKPVEWHVVLKLTASRGQHKSKSGSESTAWCVWQEDDSHLFNLRPIPSHAWPADALGTAGKRFNFTVDLPCCLEHTRAVLEIMVAYGHRRDGIMTDIVTYVRCRTVRSGSVRSGPVHTLLQHMAFAAFIAQCIVSVASVMLWCVLWGCIVSVVCVAYVVCVSQNV